MEDTTKGIFDGKPTVEFAGKALRVHVTAADRPLEDPLANDEGLEPGAPVAQTPPPKAR